MAEAAGALGDVYVLDTETWGWWRPDTGPHPLPPIAYHAAALAADKIFVFGGSTRDQLYNDVLMLDTSSCQWQVRERRDRRARPPPRAPESAPRARPPLTRRCARARACRAPRRSCKMATQRSCRGDGGSARRAVRARGC